MIELLMHREGGKPLRALVPENWDELSEAQMLLVAKKLAGSKTISEVATALLVSIVYPFRRSITRSEIGAQVLISEGLPLLDWMAEPAEMQVQPLPVIGVGFWRWQGPAAGFRNLRFSEFHFAEVAFWAYQEGKEIQYLRELVAVLWRPKKLSADPDDCRKAFVASRIAGRMKKQADLPEELLLAAHFWYAATRQTMVEEHPRIFRSTSSESEDGSDLPSYFPLMRAIAKEGTYGNFENVEEMYLLNALEELEAAKDEEEAMKKAIEEARKS